MSPGLFAIFLTFARISVLSVGGGTMAWTRDQVVTRNRWLEEDDFAQALAVCQLMPGANTLNMATFLGSQLAGWRGSVAAVAGLTCLPFVLVLGLALVYGRVEQGPHGAALFQGLGAGAAGVALGTGLDMGRKNLRERRLLLLALLVYLALTVWRLNMIAVVLGVIALASLLYRSES